MDTSELADCKISERSLELAYGSILVEEWMDGWMDGWMDRRTDGRTGGRADGWMD